MNSIAPPTGGNYAIFKFIGQEQDRIQGKEYYSTRNEAKADSMRGKLDINRIYLAKDGDLKTSSNALSHAWRMMTGKATGQGAIRESIRAFVGSDNGALVEKLMANFNQALHTDRGRIGTIPGTNGEKVLSGHEKVGWSERSHAFDALQTTLIKGSGNEQRLSPEAAEAMQHIYQAAMEKAPAVGKELASKIVARTSGNLGELKQVLANVEKDLARANQAADEAGIDIDDGHNLAAHFASKEMDVPSASTLVDRYSVENLSSEENLGIDPHLDGLVLKGLVDELKTQIQNLAGDDTPVMEKFDENEDEQAQTYRSWGREERQVFEREATDFVGATQSEPASESRGSIGSASDDGGGAENKVAKENPDLFKTSSHKDKTILQQTADNPATSKADPYDRGSRGSFVE